MSLERYEEQWIDFWEEWVDFVESGDPGARVCMLGAVKKCETTCLRALEHLYSLIFVCGAELASELEVIKDSWENRLGFLHNTDVGAASLNFGVDWDNLALDIY